MSDLVQRLANGEHAVEATVRPERTVAAFKKTLDRGYVHVTFTETKGGTELGVRLDPAFTDLTRADFARETGSLTVAGTLVLDYVKVRCTAQIDLPGLCGRGHLDILEEPVA